MLRIYNTLNRRIEKFIPLQAPQVKMYVCGVTSYDVCHLGHARTAINFDVILRYLRSQDYKVIYVRNITDIDDKIIQRANAENCEVSAIVEKYIDKMHTDYRDLRLLPPDREPRATEHIQEIVQFIARLMQKDYAYRTAAGDVCFRARKYKEYGRLSHRKIDELYSGLRVEIDEHKEDAVDFVLWKASKAGEPSWRSPWGDGRPGWHIECSAMAQQHLGDTFDIHGGGSDLIFPHHENEIAQSSALTAAPLANYWLHCAPLTVQGQKMSKSLNNFVSIRELLDEYHPEELRYFLICGHYRSPLDWSSAAMEQACASLQRLYIALNDFSEEALIIATPADAKPSEEENAFFEAMDNDFNTPQALAALFALANRVQKTQEAGIARALLKCGRILGMLGDHPQDFLRRNVSSSKKKKVQGLIAQREQARLNKNWHLADQIRQQLDEMGILLEDGPHGTGWRSK